ncbi:hypothetical protein FACS1894164_13310 [Spirochaetia bacterium]|nr:hypothetical protein FACS1894164_13310 [Spirochaetia bacterium]
MGFKELMERLLGQASQTSKIIVSKTGEAAQDIGERGVISVEIHQLEGQVRKLINRLGAEVYTAFIEEDADEIARDDARIKATVDELVSLQEAIDQREAMIQERKDAIQQEKERARREKLHAELQEREQALARKEAALQEEKDALEKERAEFLAEKAAEPEKAEEAPDEELSGDDSASKDGPKT